MPPKEYLLLTTPQQIQLPQVGILLYDDFSGPLNWTGSVHDGENTIDIATARTGINGNCLRIIQGVTGLAEDDTSNCSVRLPLLGNGIITLHTTLLTPAKANIKYIDFSFTAALPPTAWLSGLRFDRANTKWQYFNDGATYTDIANATEDFTDAYPYPITLVVDLTTQEYISFSAGQNTHDLSAIPIYKSVAATSTYLSLKLQVQAAGGTAFELFLDQMAITQRHK